MLARQTRGDLAESGAGLSDGDVGREPRERVELLAVSGEPPVQLAQRDPQLRLLGELEPRLHDTDDRMGDLVERDGLAEDLWVTPEPPLPEPITEHHDPVAAGLVLVCTDAPAEHGLLAE